jgi:hypothetical protein
MKKIIAAAVAAAFVAPVYAADITVGGEVEMTYVTATGAQDSMSTAESVVVVSASDEVNGVSINASIVIDEDDSNEADDDRDGASLSLGFGGATLRLGDTAGGMDSVGDYTDIAPAYGGFGLDGSDHSIAVVLPSMMGLNVTASMTPDGGGANGTTDGESGVGVSYNFPNGQVYYGSEEQADGSTHDAIGVRYTFNGIYVAYEKGNDNDGANADIAYTGFALRYTMGDVVVGMESQEVQTDGVAASTDDTVVFVEYNLGPVDLYVSQRTADGTGANTDGTTVGVEYAF